MIGNFYFDDYIDSRDIISAIDEIQQLIDENEDLIQSADGDMQVDVRACEEEIKELREELEMLQDVDSEGSIYSRDWSYGETLINESCFTDYIEQLIDDCYNIPEGWPMNHLDYEAAAEEAKIDYKEVELDGTTYLIRAC